ncbi:hypothetical protein FACS18948_7450 [Clostridia bacterium]|nr:hypothetical protein FACS18948_7450 [Clostridia bacterium]
MSDRLDIPSAVGMRAVPDISNVSHIPDIPDDPDLPDDLPARL